MSSSSFFHLNNQANRKNRFRAKAFIMPHPTHFLPIGCRSNLIIRNPYHWLMPTVEQRHWCAVNTLCACLLHFGFAFLPVNNQKLIAQVSGAKRKVCRFNVQLSLLFGLSAYNFVLYKAADANLRKSNQNLQ